MLHKNISTNDNHIVHNWTVSDSAARVALSTTLGSADIGKIAYQTDNSSFYILQASTTGSNFTWQALGGGAGGGGVAVSAGTNSTSTGTVVFSNSNGVSFGMSTNGVITASVAGAGAAGSISAGTTSVALGQAIFSNSNNVSFGLNGSTLTATATFNQTADTNKAGTGFSSAGLNIGLSGTLNTDGFSLSATVPTQSVQTQNLIQQVVAGTQTKTSGSLSFANSNGITFGMSGTNTITASHNGLTQQSTQPVAVSGSNGSFAFSTVSFGNSNGMSFYTTNGSVVGSYTVPNAITNINISGGTTSNNTSGFILSNSNNVSFGLNGGTFTATATFNQTVQTQNMVSVNGSTGNISFSNSNGITFGANNSTITASYTVPTTAGLISNVKVSAGTTDANATGISFSNANGVTFGLNGSTITASVAPGAGGGSFTAGVSNIGNTSGSTGTVSNRIVFAGGNNITLSQSTDGGGATVTISGANIGGAQTGISGIIASNTTYTSGTISFSDANGVSFGTGAGQAINITHGLQFTSNTSNITANALNTSASRVINIIAATNAAGAGNASLSSNISFTNANGATFYTSAGNAIAVSYTVPTQSVQTQNMVSIQGSTGNISFNNANGITFGANASTITASHNGLTSQSVQTQSNVQGIGAGTQTGRTGDVVFADSNGISFGMSGSSRVTASYTVPSTAGLLSAINVSGGTTSNNVQQIVFNNQNGISFGLNSNTITATHNGLTTARASNDGVGLNTAQTNVTWTVNSSGISLNASGYAGTGTTFNGTNASASITQNSNGIRLDLSVAGGGAADGWNQAQFTNSTANSTMALVWAGNSNGSGNITLGLTGSTITGSAAGGGGGAFTAGMSTLGNTSGTTGMATNQIVFVGGNNVTLSQSTGAGGNTLTISAANSLPEGAIGAGTQTAFTGTVIFSNSNNISFGMSNNSVVTASFAGNNSQTNTLFFNAMPASTTGLQIVGIGVSTASAHFFPFYLPYYFEGNLVQIACIISQVTSTVSGRQSFTLNYGLYSNNNSTLSQISSGSLSSQGTYSSVSATLSYPASTNTAGYTYSSATVTATSNLQQTFGNNGLRRFDLAFGGNLSLTPGMYWLGLHNRFSSSSANVGGNFSIVGNVAAMMSNLGFLGSQIAGITTNGSKAWPWFGHGVYTSTGSAGYSGTTIPSSAMITGINHNLTVVPWISLVSK